MDQLFLVSGVTPTDVLLKAGELPKACANCLGSRQPQMLGRIFISYRRDDVPGDALGVCDALTGKLGRDSVFMDSRATSGRLDSRCLAGGVCLESPY